MNKETTNFIIKNTQLDDIYFSVINDIMPETVLDIGMFLKRNGSVSRASGGLSIKNQIILDGVDVMPSINLGVYKTIYDHITSKDDFITETYSGCFVKCYDLVIAFDFYRFIDENHVKK